MRGVAASSVNTYLRCVAAFWKWQGRDWKVPRLKEDQKILATFDKQEVKTLIAFKPSGTNQRRLHALSLLILDTGLRINEERLLTPADIDFGNMLVTVMGRGRKERKVPLSFELRKILYRYLQGEKRKYAFGTNRQTACTTRNLQRGLVAICKKKFTGVRCSWHTLRHTMAANYLRSGGKIYFLSRIPGHSSVKTTEVYLRSLGVEDLQAVHERFSLLAKL